MSFCILPWLYCHTHNGTSLGRQTQVPWDSEAARNVERVWA